MSEEDKNIKYRIIGDIWTLFTTRRKKRKKETGEEKT